MVRVLLRIAVSTLIVSAAIVLTQDLQIFPALFDSVVFNKKSEPPPYVNAITLTAGDGHSFPAWHVSAGPLKPVALLFHGNGDTLRSFVAVQRWLRALGISTYAIEYRGFNGEDSGWPTEVGFYLDTDAALSYITQTEHIAPEKLIILGSSVGTGVASYAARKANAAILILLSPYTSLSDVVRDRWVVGLLAPFLKYEFPTRRNIEALTNTCVIAVHGKQDSIIPFRHSTELQKVYRGLSQFILLESAEAGHNDLLTRMNGEIAETIKRCQANGQLNQHKDVADFAPYETVNLKHRELTQ